jgi:hypothetical protein
VPVRGKGRRHGRRGKSGSDLLSSPRVLLYELVKVTFSSMIIALFMRDPHLINYPDGPARVSWRGARPDCDCLIRCLVAN